MSIKWSWLLLWSFFPGLLFVDLAPEEKLCGLYCQQELPTEKSLVFYFLAG